MLETLLLPLRLRLFPWVTNGEVFVFKTTQTEFGIKDYLLDIFFIKPFYTNGWFLSYIAMWYLIFYFAMRIRDELAERLGDSGGQAVKWAIIAAACLWIFFFRREIWAEQALSFAVGILISDIRDKNSFEKIQDWKISLILFAVGTIFLSFKQIPYVRQTPEFVMKVVQLLIKLPYGLVVVMLPFLLRRIKALRVLIGKLNCVFYSIGMISFELYLIHGYVLNGVGDGVLDAVVWVVITGVISLIFHYLVGELRQGFFSKTKS